MAKRTPKNHVHVAELIIQEHGMACALAELERAVESLRKRRESLRRVINSHLKR